MNKTNNEAKRVYDSQDMAARGRIGAYRLRATHNPCEYTLSARNAFMARFTPHDPSLTDIERQSRADAALKAYMLTLSRKSALSRRKNNPVSIA